MFNISILYLHHKFCEDRECVCLVLLYPSLASGMYWMLRTNEGRKELSEVHLTDTLFLGWRAKERTILETASAFLSSPEALFLQRHLQTRGGTRQWFQFRVPKIAHVKRRSRNDPTQLSLNTYQTEAMEAK